MSLVNFGSILGFAEEIEDQHQQFYSDAARHPDCSSLQDVFEGLAKESNKRLKEIKRVRRENVTEMILETIEGFRRDSFIVSLPQITDSDCSEVVLKSFELVDRSLRFYEQAAERLKGQSEVARTLGNMNKKHEKDRKKLEGV